MRICRKHGSLGEAEQKRRTMELEEEHGRSGTDRDRRAVLEMCPKTNHMMILYGHFIS